ncbi:hypothetical protein ACLKMY_36895 [Paraburkholderia mimosarum]|uniref:hypothetical protein n=1 Tax=Paraburkholderia mimosarum TaxID=312026 RepID=UPI000AFF4D5D|nr:hypothetical protein [Paraburkholderia mimosarum]
MTLQSIVRNLLRLRLALSRFGTGPLLAGALLAAAMLLWLGVLPGMSARVVEQTRAVARLRALPVPKPIVPAPVLAASRLADFYAELGDSTRTGEIVMRLFDAAAAAGVTLDKAEYTPGHDAPGRFDTYTIVLPVKGDYVHLRQFSEKVLVTVPYAALDDMRFKRNSANDPSVEANLRFTAFLRPVTIAPVSASAVAAAAASAAAVSAASQAGAVGTSGVSAGAGPSGGSSGVPLPTIDSVISTRPPLPSGMTRKSRRSAVAAPSIASAPPGSAIEQGASALMAISPQKSAAPQGATR